MYNFNLITHVTQFLQSFFKKPFSRRETNNIQEKLSEIFNQQSLASSIQTAESELQSIPPESVQDSFQSCLNENDEFIMHFAFVILQKLRNNIDSEYINSLYRSVQQFKPDPQKILLVEQILKVFSFDDKMIWQMIEEQNFKNFHQIVSDTFHRLSIKNKELANNLLEAAQVAEELSWFRNELVESMEQMHSGYSNYVISLPFEIYYSKDPKMRMIRQHYRTQVYKKQQVYYAENIQLVKK